jgi:hypothetical protein
MSGPKKWTKKALFFFFFFETAEKRQDLHATQPIHPKWLAPSKQRASLQGARHHESSLRTLLFAPFKMRVFKIDFFFFLFFAAR